jgi:DNA processing protein
VADYDAETLALLRLSLCKGVSHGTIYALVERFGSAVAALESGSSALQEVEGIGPGAARAIGAAPDGDAIERELELTEKHRARLVPYFADEYPSTLRHLDRAAPVLLRVRGELKREDALAVAVVGSRHCSAYGRKQASRLASDLASMGFTIVSGMAAGIDAAAHRGALLGRGRTIAVLGCGLSRVDEPQMELMLEIAEHGSVVTELAMETPARPGNFPPRNRIISGLSLGVVVVEAATRSGSLITARLAGEQGRAVCAVPGNVDSPASHGCHQLIRDGAVLVESARDVAEALGPLAEPVLIVHDAAGGEAGSSAQVEDARVLALNDRERGIFEMVGPSPIHIDEVVTETGLPPSIVSSTLMTLEIRGLIRQLAGQRYVRG